MLEFNTDNPNRIYGDIYYLGGTISLPKRVIESIKNRDTSKIKLDLSPPRITYMGGVLELSIDEYEALNNYLNVNEAKFDFQDGKGPVPAKRHVNPDGSEGGWVADTAYVAPTVYVGKDAVVFGNACVSDNAWISGNARVVFV